MIIVDTSIWIDHLGKPDARLVGLLDRSDVYCHPHVMGELGLGNLRQFDIVIRFMNKLPKPEIASDAEVLAMIKERKLHGTGIGYSDAHLIASALLTPAALIWSRDRRLNVVAQRFGIAWTN